MSGKTPGHDGTSDGDGDHERFAHYVDKHKIVDSAVSGTPVVALCGKVWVPSRDPKRFPVCPECKEILTSRCPRARTNRAGGLPSSLTPAVRISSRALVDRVRGHPGGEVQQDPGVEPGRRGVGRGRPDAVVGGQAGDVATEVTPRSGQARRPAGRRRRPRPRSRCRRRRAGPCGTPPRTGLCLSGTWNSAPYVCATQCGGQVLTKSGSAEKCEPGSM